MFKTILSFLIGFALLSWLSGLITGDSNLASTKLTVPVDSTDNAIIVESTTGFPSSGYLMVQDERMYYPNKNALSFMNLTRGIDQTTATSHPLYSNGKPVRAYTEDLGGLNAIMGFDAGAIMSSYGLAGIPVLGLRFCTITLPMIIAWENLSWMTGMLSYIRTILILISAGLTVALFIVGINNLISAKK